MDNWIATLKSTTLVNWVQIITGISVVVGLVLVIWELQQSRDVAIAQLTSDAIGQAIQIDLAETGENPNIALTKACEDPSSLTNEDLTVLQGYYFAQLVYILRGLLVEQRSGLYTGVWIEAAYARFGSVFSTQPGRVWWSAQRNVYPKEMVDLGDSILMELYPSTENSTQGCYLDAWREAIQTGSDFLPRARHVTD